MGFCTRDDEVVGCSPDSLVIDADGSYVAGLEIKCPMAKHHAAYLIEGSLPDAYKAQVHGSMAVTGLTSWWFMSYCEGLAPFILKVDANGYTDQVSEALDKFVIFYAAHRAKLIPLLKNGAAA